MEQEMSDSSSTSNIAYGFKYGRFSPPAPDLAPAVAPGPIQSWEVKQSHANEAPKQKI